MTPPPKYLGVPSGRGDRIQNPICKNGHHLNADTVDGQTKNI